MRDPVYDGMHDVLASRQHTPVGAQGSVAGRIAAWGLSADMTLVQRLLILVGALLAILVGVGVYGITLYHDAREASVRRDLGQTLAFVSAEYGRFVEHARDSLLIASLEAPRAVADTAHVPGAARFAARSRLQLAAPRYPRRTRDRAMLDRRGRCRHGPIGLPRGDRGAHRSSRRPRRIRLGSVLRRARRARPDRGDGLARAERRERCHHRRRAAGPVRADASRAGARGLRHHAGRPRRPPPGHGAGGRGRDRPQPAALAGAARTAGAARPDGGPLERRIGPAGRLRAGRGPRTAGRVHRRGVSAGRRIGRCLGTRLSGGPGTAGSCRGGVPAGLVGWRALHPPPACQAGGGRTALARRRPVGARHAARPLGDRPAWPRLQCDGGRQGSQRPSDPRGLGTVLGADRVVARLHLRHRPRWPPGARELHLPGHAGPHA